MFFHSLFMLDKFFMFSVCVYLWWMWVWLVITTTAVSCLERLISEVICYTL